MPSDDGGGGGGGGKPTADDATAKREQLSFLTALELKSSFVGVVVEKIGEYGAMGKRM